MFSKILIKLIDNAIIPAILLLAARLISVVLVSRHFNYTFEINTSGFLFSNASDYIVVNSYSLAAMIVVLTIGLIYILIKAYLFHETHVSPVTTAKMFSYGISSFIQSSFELYTQGTIWLSYSYLMLFITGIMALFHFVFPWVFFTSLALTIISTALLILDVENEMNVSKIKEPIYDKDLKYLNNERELE